MVNPMTNPKNMCPICCVDRDEIANMVHAAEVGAENKWRRLLKNWCTAIEQQNKAIRRKNKIIYRLRHKSFGNIKADAIEKMIDSIVYESDQAVYDYICSQLEYAASLRVPGSESLTEEHIRGSMPFDPVDLD
jgi:hypothetical protein